jgi:hypothetical protein
MAQFFVCTLRRITDAQRVTVSPFNPVSQACRPMADFLFAEALGMPQSYDTQRIAKEALLPLRSRPGRIGWAVMILLEGADSRVAYDDAVSVLLDAARGGQVGPTVDSGPANSTRRST